MKAHETSFDKQQIFFSIPCPLSKLEISNKDMWSILKYLEIQQYTSK